MGTLQNRLRGLFECIVSACSELNLQLVLSLGRHDAELVVPSTSSAIIVPYAPQLKLLARAVAVVTHGGLNTVLETLSQGLPMVTIPLTNDQPGVARRLESLGVAVIVPPSAAINRRLCEAVKQILREPRYRESAEHCLKQLRCAPNVADAAAIVGHALTNRVHVTRADARAVLSQRLNGRIPGS